jgi:hypothetical protein
MPFKLFAHLFQRMTCFFVIVPQTDKGSMKIDFFAAACQQTTQATRFGSVTNRLKNPVLNYKRLSAF